MKHCNRLLISRNVLKCTSTKWHLPHEECTYSVLHSTAICSTAPYTRWRCITRNSTQHEKNYTEINMASCSRAQVISLYRMLMKESQKFPSYNYRYAFDYLLGKKYYV